MLKKQLLELHAYSPGKSIDEVKREYGLKKIVKLASNENPFGCSPKVPEALTSLSGQFALYPDGGAYELRKQVAAHLNVEPEQLLFGSGLDEVIQMLSRSILSAGTNTVMAKPTFSQYRHHAVIENAEVREVPLKDGTHDLEAMLSQIDKHTKIVWICNPNNPTGTYVNTKELEGFMAGVPKTTLVVMDEAYYEYATAEDYPDTLSLLPNYENMVVLRTFSKAYGLASFRMGYAVGHASFISRLQAGRLPFNTSSFAQAAAIAALKDQAFIEQCVTANKQGLKRYYEFCKKHDINYYPSQANFIFMEVGDGNAVFQELLQAGYIVRSGAGLGLPNGIRVTIGSQEENEEIIALLEKVVAKKENCL
jgi:histidinol-phosphate aminotransferase